MKMIVKEILSGSVYTRKNLRISSFKPNGMREMLLTLSEDDFVLGVGYEQGDYQICISGRKKSKEEISHTFNREMYEELSIVPSKLPLFYTKHQNNYFTKVRIADTQLLEPNLFAETDDDDTKERGIVCVYGKITEIMNYLGAVDIYVNNNDSITHLWADSVKNILKYI